MTSPRTLIRTYQDKADPCFLLDIYQYQKPYFNNGKEFKGICKNDPVEKEGKQIFLSVYEIEGSSEEEIIRIAHTKYRFSAK